LQNFNNTFNYLVSLYSGNRKLPFLNEILKMKLFLYCFLLSVFTVSSSNAQYEDIILEDYVYVTNIKSVSFYPSGNPLEPPIVYLGNRQNLLLSFDDLENVQKEFSYEIVHCNKDWTAFTDMERLEYIDGFQDEEIDDSAFSVNTFVPYINYRLPLPNRDLSWTISGNYLLIVYEGMDLDYRIPVISRRFMVVDKQVNVIQNGRRPLDVSKLRTHHEFDLFVNNKDFPIIDPRNNVYVTIIQNYRWDSAIDNLNPKFTVGDKMTIDNTGKVSFPAYKEFRPIDIRTLDYTSNGVKSIDLNDYGTNVLLDLGKSRRDSYYTTVPDANGQFVIQNKDQGNARVGGDYANVIFTLQTPKLEEEVYVAGRFTDWKPDEMYRMRYYEDREVYVAEIQLKQGFYDFFYAVDVDGKLDPAPIEGSWADAENMYQVLVYLQVPGGRYDRLIGYLNFNSNEF
jgi:hypothetical protein